MRTLLSCSVIASLAIVTNVPSARAERPPYAIELGRWAQQRGYTLSDYRNCKGLEEKHFGSWGSVCWLAKQLAAEPGTQLHPRMAITLAVYKDEAAARERMARFQTVPDKLIGEEGKLYPLRAGFQVGSRVIVITTDALSFVPHIDRAAAELAQLTHGINVTCWQKCSE